MSSTWQGLQHADAANDPSRPTLALPLDWRDLAKRTPPAREWFLPGWLGPGPTLLAGAGGSGKSTLVQSTATALAVGSRYFEAPSKPLRSLVWNCEDSGDELWRRQVAICEQLEVDMPSLSENLIVISRFGLDNALMVEGQGRRLQWTALQQHLIDYVHDLRVDLVWLDNAAHLLMADHDNRSVVTAFVNGLAGMVTDRPFGVVIVAHPGRAIGSEYSGSVAWENAVRMRWYLGSKLPDQKSDDDEPATSTRFLAKRKSNYSAQDYIRFTMRGSGLLVPDPVELSHVSGLMASIDQAHAEDALLKGFDHLRGMGLTPTDGKNSQDFLPRLMVDRGLAGPYAKRDLERALFRLMDRGILFRGVAGKYGNRSPKQGLLKAGEQEMTCTK